MRRPLLFLILLLVLATAFIAWRYWWVRPGRSTSEPASAGAVSDTNSGSITIPKQIVRQVASNLGTLVPQSKESEYKEGLRNLNHVPIDYYGRVIDDLGVPLSSTKVKWTVFYKDGFREGSKSGEAFSDGDGRFSVLGETGQSITLIPERLGYVFVATNSTAIYSRLWSQAERNNSSALVPTVLMMRKLRGAEELIKVDQNFQLTGDSSTVILDFLTGQRVETGGDLKVIVQRADGNMSYLNPGSWSLTLKPVEGGIAEIADQHYRYALEAPESGYMGDWRFQMDEKSRWFPQANGCFVIRTRGGRIFGKISVIFYINEMTNAFQRLSVAGVINPNGSRNLEEDPAKIRKPR